MAFYEVLFRQTCWGQQCVNIFNFYSSAPGDIPGGAADVIEVFRTDVAGYVRQMLRLDPAEYTADSIYGWAVNDPTDFAEYLYAPNSTGYIQAAGQAAPPFMSFSFRTDRWRTGRNRGAKRFAGICEGNMAGNTFNPGGTILADLKDALEQTLVGVITAYYPTVAGKLKYVPDPLKPTVYAYKYYPTEAEQRAESALNVTWNPYELTTQRSRKAGYGA